MSLFTPAELGALDSRFAQAQRAGVAYRSVVFQAAVAEAPASIPLPSTPSGAVLLLFVNEAGAVSKLDATVRDRIIQVAAIPAAGSVLAFYVTGDGT